MSDSYYGVHFGCSNAYIAAMKTSANVDVIANDSGDRATPTAFYYSQNEKVAGLAAKQALMRDSANVVRHPLRWLSAQPHHFAHLDQDSTFLPKSDTEFKYDSGKHNLVFNFGNDEGKKKLNVVDALNTVLQKLYSFSNSEESPQPAVFALPEYCLSDLQILTKFERALTKSGWEAARFISFSSAALLANGIGQTDPKSTGYCLVFRSGGLSTDVAVFRLVDGMYLNIGYEVNYLTGGDTMTDSVAIHLAEEFNRKTRFDVTGMFRPMAKLTAVAEEVKCILSTNETGNCFAESVYDGLDFSYKLTRARFESLIASQCSAMLALIPKVLLSAGITDRDVNHLVLAGGTSKIPKLQQLVCELFPNATTYNTMSADEAIVIGATIQASCIKTDLVKPQTEDVMVNTVTRDICFKYTNCKKDEVLNCVVPHGSIVPLKRKELIDLPAVSENGDFTLQVYEDRHKHLGDVVLKQLKESVDIHSTIFIDSDGCVTVSIIDLVSNVSEEITF